MRRWSKEPRRMSVVEGSAAASLARGSLVLSLCFIYIHETTKAGPCQGPSKHFYKILFFSIRRPITAHRARPERTDDARLSAPSHVGPKIRWSRQDAKNAKRTRGIFLAFFAPWRDTIFPL